MLQRHSFTALNSTFVVDAEYQFVKELGQGAYGCVVAAKHRRTGEGCAVKKITNINTKVRAGCDPSGKRPRFADSYDLLSSCTEDPHEEMSARNQVCLALAFPFLLHMYGADPRRIEDCCIISVGIRT